MANTSARGYGWRHQQLRALIERKMAQGVVFICARAGCGKPILPGQPWDLGHGDGDRTRYAGPEHAFCNRATAGRRRPRRRTSRDWFA
jgi:hypothetical protein